MVSWSIDLGTVLLVLGALLAAWIDIRMKLALLRRDQQWLMAQLKKWGLITPANGK